MDSLFVHSYVAHAARGLLRNIHVLTPLRGMIQEDKKVGEIEIQYNNDAEQGSCLLCGRIVRRAI